MAMNNKIISFWAEDIKLKNLSFPRFMSAPMDGVIDSPMRQMIRKFSTKELLFTEMRHVSCVANEKTEKSVKYKPIEQPLAFQISANSINFTEKAVQKIIENKFVMLNLNAGCPAKCVIKSGSGCALMANPTLLKTILCTLKKELNNIIPLTIKIRAGFKEKNALEISQLAQDCGVELIIIHPRTQPGKFASQLDFDLVKQIKAKLSIPIVFSGNINSFKSAKIAYEKTNADGFMIGRALWGCPWKMKEIAKTITKQEFHMPINKILEYAIEHLNLNLEHYGTHGFNGFKKQLPQYIKGLPQAAQIRKNLLRLQTAEEMKTQLSNLIQIHVR